MSVAVSPSGARPKARLTSMRWVGTTQRPLKPYLSCVEQETRREPPFLSYVPKLVGRIVLYFNLSSMSWSSTIVCGGAWSILFLSSWFTQHRCRRFPSNRGETEATPPNTYRSQHCTIARTCLPFSPRFHRPSLCWYNHS